MPADQLPDIKAEAGEIVAQPMPEPMEEMFLVCGWHSEDRAWIHRGPYDSRDDAEHVASRLLPSYTHYRIVRIPGDEKGGEHE